MNTLQAPPSTQLKVGKLAFGAGLWYNEVTKLLSLRSIRALLRHASSSCLRRLDTMDTISSYPQNDNPSKQCTGPCGRFLSATSEYFHRDKKAKYGLRSNCKQCCSTSKRSVSPNGQKICTGPCGRMLPATSEFFYARNQSKDGFQHKCKECVSEYYVQNRDQILANNKAHNDKPENKKRRSEYEKKRRYNPETRDDFLAMKRSHWHKPAHKQRLKEYYSRPEVKESKRLNDRKRYHDPVIGDYVRKQKRVRTLSYIARKKSVKGTHTPQQIQDQLKRQKHTCYYCQKKFNKIKGQSQYHIDHTFPLSRVKGTDIPANSIDYIVLACPTCNMSKHDKFPWEWPEGGRLL